MRNLSLHRFCSVFGSKWTLSLALALLTACAGTRQRPFHPEPVELMGDWNDLDASIETAAHFCEMALEYADRSSIQVVFHLRTDTDEPATLTATRRDPASTAPQLIHLQARAGRHGNQQQESDLLYEVVHRLKALRGVDTAPID